MPELSERAAVFVLMAGCVVYFVGWFWLLVRAFREGVWWAVGVALIPFFLGQAYYFLTRFRRALPPHVVMLAGLLLAATPYVYQQLNPPRRMAVVQQVNGERRGTLTGATDTNLVADLKADTGRAVLQLANRPDVTDDTLKLLADFPELRELDLNDTPITDTGLEFLAGLPKLESLRIARTKVTPDGVARHVLGNPKLKQIDVTGLGVPAKALREWKNADPTARKYVN